jgi:hypothetical protein
MSGCRTWPKLKSIIKMSGNRILKLDITILFITIAFNQNQLAMTLLPTMYDSTYQL